MIDQETSAELRASVRKLAESEIPKFRSHPPTPEMPRSLFAAFARDGLAAVSISADIGGLGLSARHAVIVMEEIAAVQLGPAIFLSVHWMTTGIVDRHGNAQQRTSVGARMASGDLLGAFALTEPSAGSDAAHLKCTYRRDGRSFVLDGEKCYITSAGWADIYIVFARAQGSSGAAGISAFIVPADTPGLTVGKPEKKMGCEMSPIASVTFAGARIDESALLGEEGRGYSIALSGLSGGRVNIAACAVGLSRAALDRAAHHLNNREQFGQNLIEFQGLQFMLADMKMSFEAARLMTDHAAGLLSEGSPHQDARVFSSMAKCFATDAAMRITTDAVQLLGGAGYLQDYTVERLMRDAKMLQIVEGTNQIQRALIARSMKAD